VIEYRSHKYQRVEPVNDDGPRSSHGSRRGNPANFTKLSLSSKQSSKAYPLSTYKSLMLGTDREYKGRQRSTLAWGDLWRRDVSTQSEGVLDPVLRYAMSQLQGTMVTGYYGNGYNCWPEDNIRGLSSLIFCLWADIASNQDLTSNLREELIDTMPTYAEGRKVKSKLNILNNINTLTVV
jgi:hypothetical protein